MAVPLQHKTSTFVVMDFNQEFAWPPIPGKKGNPLSLALERLLSGLCQLVLVTRDSNRLQISLEFDTIQACIEEVGDFARQAFKTGRLSLPVHIGIATGEAPCGIRPEQHPALREAKWMTGLHPEPAIFISETTATLARHLTIHPYGVEEYGDFYNFTLGETYRLFVLTHPQLPDFPKVDDERPRHNIPWQDNFFIGRAEEIDQIIDLLDNHRAVSLVGGSGVGKSLLAKRIGLELLDRLRDGVKYVDLTGAEDQQAIFSRIFRSIGLPVQDVPRLDLELLRKHFGARSHLVILDGCDGSADLLPPIIKELLDSRLVRILMTSIQPLQMRGLHAFLIEDLPVPQRANTIKELDETDSSALLLDGIRRYRQGFPPEDSEAPMILEICRRTNGNPLTIQLIARRLRHDSLNQILDSLKRPSATGSLLNPAVAGTLARLDSTSRAAIEHAAMFVGPWSLVDLVDMADIPHFELSHALEGLVQLGIAEKIEDGEDGPKFILQSHFREGARTNLHLEGRLNEMRETHFLAFYSRVRDSIKEINGPQQKRHLDRLDVLRHDFEEALRYLIECRPDPSEFDEAMKASWLYWYQRNRLTSVINLASMAIERCPNSKGVLRARMLMLQAIFLIKAGGSSDAIEILEQALTIAKTTGDHFLCAQVQNNLGIAYWADAKALQALHSYEEAAAYGRAEQIAHLDMSATTGLSACLIDLGRLREAKAALEHLEELSLLSCDRIDLWNVAIGWAEYHCEMGDSSEALFFVNKAVAIAVENGDISTVSRSFMWKSRILLDLRQIEEAALSISQCLNLMASGEHQFNKINTLRLIELEMRLGQVLTPAKLAELRILSALQKLLS